MKKIHILSLGVAWMLGLVSYAQNSSSEDNDGLRYWYDLNGGSFVDNTSMGDPVFVGFDNYDDSEAGFLETLDEEPLKENATEAYVAIYADGFLRLTGRQLCYTPYKVDLLSNTSSTILTFGGFEKDDETNTLDLPSNIVTYDEGEEHYVVNDPYRKYWLVYRAVLAAGIEIYRGSDIDADYDANGTEISHVMYQNELMYLKKDNKYYPVTSVDLGGNDPNAYPMQLVDCTKKFVINEYPENLLDGCEVQTVRIKSDVTVLPSFTNSKVNKFDFVETNAVYTSVSVSDENSALCTKDADGKPVSVVALPMLKNKTITLPYEVSSINEGALPNGAEGLIVVTANAEITNNSSLVELKDGEKPEEGVNYLYKDIPLTLTKSPLSVLASYMKQKAENSSFGFISSSAQSVKVDEFKKYLSELANTSGLSYIDLSNCIFNTNNLGSVDLSGINANCLLFLPEGVTATGDNIITMSNGVRSCAKLKLVRQSGVSFANPYEFTAADVSVDYSVGGNMVGLVLPFDYSNDNLFFATFNGYNEGYLEFNNTVTEVLANTPFLTCTKEGVSASQKITASNVKVKQTPTADATSFSNGWAMNGTYLTVTNNGNSNCTIYGFASNKLRKSNGATFKPFTGYFVCDNSVPAANEAKFRFVSDATTGVDSSESIFAVKAQDGVISVIASGENVVIASVNGAVLFNGKVNGSLTKEVNSGVYIVNGKKVVVNK